MFTLAMDCGNKSPVTQIDVALYNTLKGYVNKLDNFTGATREGVTAEQGVNFIEKTLQVAIEPGKATLNQWEQIGKAMNYAKEKGIGFNLQFIK